MRLYFDRHGTYRGFSTGPVFWIATAIAVVVLALAFGYQLFLLAPVIALWALVIWLAKPLFRRGSHAAKTGSGQESDAASH